MRTIIGLVVIKPSGGGTGLKKECDLPFALQVGMDIEDAVWDSEKPIKSISYNVEDEYFDVSLGLFTPSADEYDEVLKMYKAHGWVDVCADN